MGYHFSLQTIIVLQVKPKYTVMLGQLLQANHAWVLRRYLLSVIESFHEFIGLNKPLHQVDKIKMFKKAYIQSPDEERMFKAVRKLNSGWKKFGSITQNLRFDLIMGGRGT